MTLKRNEKETKKQYARRLLSLYQHEVGSQILNPGSSSTALKRITKIEKELVKLVDDFSYQSSAY